MTAFAGYWRYSGGGVDDRCRRMLEAQRIYAPDAPSQWDGDGISMGRRQFKLLPEDAYDHGPIVSRSTGQVLVADVRLDNRDELQGLLNLPAAEAREMSDAAFLLAALERWKEEALAHLVGDFAFAHWDPRERRLLLARDFAGQRPLHFHLGSGFFAFSSMPKGLHALEEVPREPDVEAATRFLALMPETVGSSYFKDVRTLPPAHFCVVTPGGISTHRHWNPPRTELRLPRAADYQEALRESFDRAVAARLRGADGKVASHLSGGLDSSTVTATAARLVGEGGRVCAFTAVPREGYSDPVARGHLIDEGPAAAALAAMHPRIEHILIRSGGQSPLDGLERNFFLYERPVLNLCNGVWWDAISNAARDRGLRVLLTGQRGNMGFSYTGMHLLPELLAQGRLLKLAGLLRSLPGRGVSFRGAVAQTIGPFLPRSLWAAISRLRGRHEKISDYSAINPKAAQRLQQQAEAAGLHFSYPPRRDPFGSRLWMLDRVDLGNYTKGWLGGWGLDVRDPTSDRRLIELCLSIPTEEYLRGGQPRALARAAFADRLPPQIVNENRKGRQAADWYEGMEAARGEVVEEAGRFLDLGIAQEAIDTGMVTRLLAQWPSDGWTTNKVAGRYRLALLRALSTGHFLRKASGSNA